LIDRFGHVRPRISTGCEVTYLSKGSTAHTEYVKPPAELTGAGVAAVVRVAKPAATRAETRIIELIVSVLNECQGRPAQPEDELADDMTRLKKSQDGRREFLQYNIPQMLSETQNNVSLRF
jgi:hypothetical protein